MSIVITSTSRFHDARRRGAGVQLRHPFSYVVSLLLILASLVFAAVSIGFIGTIVWNSLPDFAHHAGTLPVGTAGSRRPDRSVASQ